MTERAFEAVPETKWALVHPATTAHLVAATLDVKCPKADCRRDLVQVQLTWHTRGHVAASAAQCSRCKSKVEFVALYRGKVDPKAPSKPLAILQWPPSIEAVSEHARQISERFAELYHDAASAEVAGMQDLAGMGYRKALEVLIKDYLIKKHPNDETRIKGMLLGDCIQTYLHDPTLKGVAARTAWLGNDWAHYEARWSDHDLDDLKSLLRIAVHFLTMQHEAERFVNEMPSGSRREPT